jgi:hypothetical protein
MPGGGDQVLHPVTWHEATAARNAIAPCCRICSTFGQGLLRIITPLIKRLAPITDKDLVFCSSSSSVTLITVNGG